ncbi:hypothetical protein [Aequorivita sp. CIP111184]|uniref:hypothetical protein n=1 Tax=Aequorivita sp. CIP111184 TaxID=2211356 RepID=UPI0015EC41F0|nr:hypothetical protein [Aequorivita sp. CIP111184]
MENTWKFFSITFPFPFHFLSTLSNPFFLHLLQYCNAALGVIRFPKHFNTTNGAAA